MMTDLARLLARHADVAECTKSTCPASYSIYGYAPNLPSTIFFVVIFAISSITFLAQGLVRKGWTGFTIAFTLGTLFESIGYVSRILLSNDPFSETGFKMNIVLLTVAPAFMAAGIYLLLKQFCFIFGPQYSRLRPQLYTYIFISCDVLSMILQGVGGALSAAAQSGSALLNVGLNVMIAGLAFQVVTLTIFAVLAGDFAVNVYKHRAELASTAALRASLKFRLFVVAVVLSFLFIFVRCAYRIAELEGGWGSKIMREETEFIVLESVMITLAALVLNAFHPAFCFPRQVEEQLSNHSKVMDHGSSDVEMMASPRSGRSSLVANKERDAT